MKRLYHTTKAIIIGILGIATIITIEKNVTLSVIRDLVALSVFV